MYRMYIDETGDSSESPPKDENSRFLSLTGVIVHLNDVTSIASPRIENIKRRCFSSDPDERSSPIVLHRKDIVQKNAPFHALRDPEIATYFNDSILSLLSDLDYRVVTVVIDKIEHYQRYQAWQHIPYHYCMEILVERYVKWLERKNDIGDVMAEHRGRRENKRLKRSFSRYYRFGTRFVSADRIQGRIPVPHLDVRKKPENITGLQLADIIAHPSAMRTRHEFIGEEVKGPFGLQVAEILTDSKYDRSQGNGRIRGYGMKWLP